MQIQNIFYKRSHFNCKIVSDSPTHHSRWQLLIKKVFFNCLLLFYYMSKITSNCIYSYMAISSLHTYIKYFFVNFFFQSIFTDYAHQPYFDKRSLLNLLLWNRWTKLSRIWLGLSPSKIMSISPTLHSKWSHY